MTRKYSRLSLYAISVLVIMLLILAGYLLLGHRLIEEMYAGRAIVPLNKVIKGQHMHPLHHYIDVADRQFFFSWLYVLFLFIIMPIILHPRLVINWTQGIERLERYTDEIDSLPESQVGWWILLAAGLTLYMELLIIRLHSSYFQLFAYFKNISLLSCFLGLGIGYARGAARPLSTALALPLFASQIAFLYSLHFLPLGKFLQNPVPEQLALGLRVGQFYHLLIAYSFIASIFAFNALCFIPLGQLTSRLMLRYPKLVSYSWNLAGSLVGILLFSLLSFLWTPPSLWIILGGLGLIAFLRKDARASIISLAAVIGLVVLLTIPFHLNQVEVYSPYQILNLVFSKKGPPNLTVNNAYYQRILDLREKNIKGNSDLEKWSQYYSLPFCFKPNPEQILVVGSGTGNDVAAARRHGALEIDAVEIDPAILTFGKMLHPEAPYDAPNVNAIVNDARAYIRQTEKHYDLIVYGLLDSHTLLTSKSGGIRLDSYVYTVEAFREARQKLKNNGIISLTFCIMRPELGRKLFLMLKEAFDGAEPIVYQTGYDGGYTFLAGEGLNKDKLIQPPTMLEVTAMFADSRLKADKSTDDWPFLYMPVRKYPISYLAILLILLAISVWFTRKLISGSGSGFSFPCFFLGAGFMLVETKGITELALVYGSTWMVISAVVAAILIMAFLANIMVMKMGKPLPYITYGFLFASLLAGLSLTYLNLAGLTPWLSRILMTTVLTLPLFFSGFAFSSELERSASVAVALSSNLLGAMLGGVLEYNSMYFGFRSLYFLALFAYGLAFIGSVRAKY